METQYIIALTSVITSTLTVFLSSFAAPRINAWYERKYRDGLVYKKTLRILLEIETYVQRNLKLPALKYISESLPPKLKELGYELDEATLSQFLQFLQPHIVQELLPDNSEALHQEFNLILGELSTVDPLLAYKISERHIISPFQRINSFWIDVAKKVGVEPKAEEKEFQLVSRLAESQRRALIDELLSKLRKDILNVAARIGKKGLKEIEAHYREQDNIRREDAQNLVRDVGEYIPKKNQHSTAEPKC